jgi:S-disulfanyl-L-cysteine oxidoreductase SoxD
MTSGIVLVGAALGAVMTAQVRTQWSGIYTAEQAKRGEAVYTQSCASCHGDDMAGADMAPALNGSMFSTNWNDQRLSDLFERIRVSMPANEPGSLSRQQGTDVVAFILFKNAAPAGQSELSSRSEELDSITYKAVKP